MTCLICTSSSFRFHREFSPSTSFLDLDAFSVSPTDEEGFTNTYGASGSSPGALRKHFQAMRARGRNTCRKSPSKSACTASSTRSLQRCGRSADMVGTPPSRCVHQMDKVEVMHRDGTTIHFEKSRDGRRTLGSWRDGEHETGDLIGTLPRLCSTRR